jgi:hypothetical protein
MSKNNIDEIIKGRVDKRVSRDFSIKLWRGSPVFKWFLSCPKEYNASNRYKEFNFPITESAPTRCADVL